MAVKAALDGVGVAIAQIHYVSDALVSKRLVAPFGIPRQRYESWYLAFRPTRSQEPALAWFRAHMGERYDWMGVLRFALPFLRQRPGKWFCSEAVAEALGVADSAGVSPGDLWEVYA